MIITEEKISTKEFETKYEATCSEDEEMRTCFDDCERFIIQLNNLIGNTRINTGRNNLIDPTMLRIS